MSVGIETRGLSYRVGGRDLVSAVDLSVSEGEVMAICGPNGAGKTTLLRLIAGELAPSQGEVWLRGRLLRSYRARELARTRAVLPQETQLPFAFTVEQVVAMGRAPYGHERAEESEQAIAEALVTADVEALASRSWLTLSGGERARVTLARVLAQDSPILLLDEPTAALDLQYQYHVLAVARGLAARRRTIVAVLHDLNLSARVADRIALIKDGRLLAPAVPWAALTRERIAEVFGIDSQVIRSPLADCPLVLPVVGTAPERSGANRDNPVLLATCGHGAPPSTPE